MGRASTPEGLPKAGEVNALQPISASQLDLHKDRPAPLLVAVEFGDTMTSVGWAVANSQEAEIDIITGWPGNGGCAQPEARTISRLSRTCRLTCRQTPTVICYDSNLNVRAWGWDCADLLARSMAHRPVGISGCARTSALMSHLIRLILGSGYLRSGFSPFAHIP